MHTTPRQRLRHFYDQALLSPDLLCLHCAHTAWNRSQGQCSRDRRQDCLLFVSDMVNRLATPRPAPRPSHRPPMHG